MGLRPGTGKIIVRLPFNTNVNVSVLVNANFLERVTLLFPNGTTRTFEGRGEGQLIGSFVLTTPQNNNDTNSFPVIVKIEHAPNGQNFIKSQVIKEATIINKLKTITVFSDDSFGDNDFNDAIVTFSFRIGK